MIAGVRGKRHGGAAAVAKGAGAGDCAAVVDAAGHIIGVDGGGHDDAVVRLNAAERHAVCDGGGQIRVGQGGAVHSDAGDMTRKRGE